MNVQPPRGTQDLLPPASERFRMHERRGGEIFERAGYRPIITPMFEDTSLFVRGVGESSDIVSKEMYTFTDRSDNSLTLRPEGTAPVMRAVISNSLHEQGLPVKLWYSAAMFRYDRPQKGRYRQHHQLGIEAIGTEDPAIDAEVIWVGKQLLESAGVHDHVLLLNSIGHPADECRGGFIEELRGFLRAHREELDEDCRRRMEQNPLRVFDCKNPHDQRVLTGAPAIEERLCADCRAHFDSVQAFLKQLDVAFTISPRLVRGLDYYTRTTFEYQSASLEAAQSTVCAGGRYDGLSETIGGPRLPGIGFGSGIERVLLAAEAQGAASAPARLDVMAVPLGADERPDAIALVRSLREAGVAADLAYGDRGLKAHLRHVNRIGARFAALIGSKEREAGVATVRDMESGEQTEIALSDIARWIGERA